ncbi:MND1 (YGL183C) [Zygosaccharomyces parabailii]|nr:MND1 (YGL183C) [Zygosaccharomyces parabailii]
MPPKKQVVTLEEKKNRILNFFQEEFSFYSMKELEKVIPKKCGISSMLVKDLVQQMIDEDGIVSVEKCGNVNVYWCFKNQITQKIYDNCQKVAQQCAENRAAIEQTKQQLQSAQANERSSTFVDTDGHLHTREDELCKTRHLEERIRSLQAQYDTLSRSRWDHDKIRSKRQEIRDKHGRLEKTTDNIELLVECLCKRFLIDSRQIKRELEIPEEFEEFSTV